MAYLHITVALAILSKGSIINIHDIVLKDLYIIGFGDSHNQSHMYNAHPFQRQAFKGSEQ